MDTEQETEPEDTTSMTDEAVEIDDIELKRGRVQSTIDDLYVDAHIPLHKRLQSCVRCDSTRAWNSVKYIFPIVDVIRKYNIKENLLNDLVAGLSASFLQFPQGLGFGMLVGLTPIYGLYTTFFPALLYMVFGTSPHVSYGTNAVLTILTSEIINKEFGVGNQANMMNITSPDVLSQAELDQRAALASMASIISGTFLLGMAFLRLGFVTTYMATSFIGGFTTAAGIHVVTSQIDKMLGIKTTAFQGVGKIVKKYIDLISKIETTNTPALLASIITLFSIFFVKTFINERYKDRLPFPVPIDLLVIVFGTIISYLANFNDIFNMEVAGNIPTGMPTPSVPSFENVETYIVDSFIIAILSFAITISLAKLCAKRNGYYINDNQELLSYGLCNIISSFFSCFPSATGPPRTMILDSMGSKTTLNGAANAVVLLLILLAIGPWFESLPVCVLAAMVVASMKGLLMQFGQLKILWQINKYDFLIWVSTCALSVGVGLEIGLAGGILISIFTIVAQNQLSKGYILDESEKGVVVIDQSTQSLFRLVPGTLIFKFDSPLYFATAERFKSRFYEGCINPSHWVEDSSRGNQLRSRFLDVKCVILDCSAFNYVDLTGVEVLDHVVKDYRRIGMKLLYARCSRTFVKTLLISGHFNLLPRHHAFYDLSSAVDTARREMTEPCMEVETTPSPS